MSKVIAALGFFLSIIWFAIRLATGTATGLEATLLLLYFFHELITKHKGGDYEC